MDRRTLWLLLPRPVRELPFDLAGIMVLTLVVNGAVFLPVVRETPLRVPLGLAFLLFVPGYVFVAALFPEAGESPTADDEHERSGIDGIERVALAFGLSIALSPLIGLALNFTPWGIRLGPIMVALTAFTLVCTAVAAVRRNELPPEERFRVPYREWYDRGHEEVFEPETRTDLLLNVLLAASIVLAVGAVSFAILFPPQGETFSAIYVLTEDDEGELVAAGDPTEMTLGESHELIVGIDNNEHRAVDYTVVVLEQNVSAENNETTVLDQRELQRYETTLEHNRTDHHRHTIEPTIVGDSVRILWLLFLDGEVPAEPSIEDTEYSNFIWVNVTDPAATTQN